MIILATINEMSHSITNDYIDIGNTALTFTTDITHTTNERNSNSSNNNNDEN